MNNDFFPRQINPQIYAYEDIAYPGLLKVGYTTKSVPQRVAEQYPTLRPDALPYKIVFAESSLREDGSYFTDHDVHRLLRANGFDNPNGEWFKCTERDVKSAVLALKNRIANSERRTQNFQLRPEQKAAIEKTSNYFKAIKQEHPRIIPHFLWNAKMRFGKTFTTYKLAAQMGLTKILILTFKPAVESS